MAIERVPTGIPGFDELVQGGFPKGSAVLLVGAPGTGKSIFGLQYLYNGAKNGETGVYVTLEQTPEELKTQASLFGWEFDALEKQKKIKFLRVPVDMPNINIMNTIAEAVNQSKATRLVVDSLSIMGINAVMYSLPLTVALEEAEIKYRAYKSRERPELRGAEENATQRLIYLFIRRIKDLGITSLLITDAGETEGKITKDGVSEYASDGIVQFMLSALGTDVSRLLRVIKMRHTENALDPRPMLMTKTGLETKQLEG